MHAFRSGSAKGAFYNPNGKIAEKIREKLGVVLN